MSQLDLVDMVAALEARDRGMARAADRADREIHDWTEQAFQYLRGFAFGHSEFISEDVSDASKACGFPQPPTDRAWGSVYRRAAKAGFIVQTGIGRSRRRNASICIRWTSMVYRGSNV